MGNEYLILTRAGARDPVGAHLDLAAFSGSY